LSVAEIVAKSIEQLNSLLIKYTKENGTQIEE